MDAENLELFISVLIYDGCEGKIKPSEAEKIAKKIAKGIQEIDKKYGEIK